MNNSKFFRLNAKDFAKGLVVAVLVAVLGGVQQMLTNHGLEIGLWDWGFITNLSVTAFVGYILKQSVSDAAGTPFGNVTEIMPVKFDDRAL